MKIARIRARELQDGDEFLTCVTRRRGQAYPITGEFGVIVFIAPIPKVQPINMVDEKRLHPDVLIDVIEGSKEMRSKKTHIVRRS